MTFEDSTLFGSNIVKKIDQALWQFEDALINPSCPEVLKYLLTVYTGRDEYRNWLNVAKFIDSSQLSAKVRRIYTKNTPLKEEIIKLVKLAAA